jgi:hypothetical protein
MRVLSRLAMSAVLCAWLACACLAQEITGNIAGSVKDPQGAVVPNATVTLTDTDKGAVIRTAKTTGGGDFSVPLLPIGHYSLTVEAPGFQKYIQSGIVLNANDKLSFHPTLAVGSAAQTVSVEANATQVELQSAQASGLISGTQIRELSLNNRNYEQLVLLQPGVSSTNNTDQLYVGAFTPFGTNSPNMSLNGGRVEQNNWLVDGFDNVDRGSNITLLTFPSVDALSEFRVIRGQYEPELGRSASGQVNVITRSGTSSLHGGGYEFLRNDFLNANDWFNKRTQISKGLANKPLPQRYNNFGGTIGGPVWIPKIYEQRNKTFFFVSEEWRRTITYTNPQAEVPTPAMLTGNFLHPVCTSWTGTVCNSTGTSINPANFSPVAQAYIKDIYSKIPAPNSTTDIFGLLPTLRNVYNFREDLFKIDHIVSQKLALSAKYLHDTIPTVDPQGFFSAGTPIPNVSTTHTNAPGSNYTVRATITLNPTFLVETGYGYSYGAIVSNPVGLITFANSPNVVSAVESKLPFKSTLTRIPSLSFQSTALSPIGTQGPYQDYNRNHTAFGNFTKVMGTHTIKFGAIYYHYQKNENSGNGNQGSFAFNNNGRPSTATTTAEASWGNFLLGHAQSFTQPSIDAFPDIRANQFEYYAQDTWRMRPNLTVSYGLRHSLFRQPTDAGGQLSNFDPKFYDPAKAPCVKTDGTLDVTLGANGNPVSACNPNYSPLNGFVFANPPSNYFGFAGTKSPYGSKVGPEYNLSIAPRLGIAWDPTGNGKTSIRSGFGLFYDSGIEFGNYEINVFSNPGFVTTFAPVAANTPAGGDLLDNPTGGAINNPFNAGKQFFSLSAVPYRTPYTEQWSLDVQHDVGGGWIADMGYYGNHGVRLPGQFDPNQPLPGAYLSCTAATPCFGGPAKTNPVIITQPVGSGNTPQLNAIRPYVGYAGIRATRMQFGSNYHSLQSQLQKAFSDGSLVNASYTWSHGLTDIQFDRGAGGATTPQNTYDIRNNYGPTAADRRHIFTANFVWNLPFLRNRSGFVGHVIGGWEVSGIQTFQTGLPLTPFTAQDVDPLGQGCLGPSPCLIRPNQLGNLDSGAPHTITQWYNKSLLADPSPTQTTEPNERPGAARAPGFWRTDLSLFKNFKFTERFTGQFRWETFNTFNHFNPVCCGSNNMGSSVFDQVTSAREPRTQQLGLKLSF